MSRLGSRRSSISPRRYHSSRRSRSRSPQARDRRRSPENRGRGSPDYSRYSSKHASKRKPAWIDEDISEDDIREQAGGDPSEFRRLKRLKLNERGVRGFWRNTPTPPPSPERRDRRTSQLGNEDKEQSLNDGSSFSLGAQASVQNGAKPEESDAGAIGTLQNEIAALGPEAVELHGKLAAFFRDWLAGEKAAAAEAEKRRRQYEADNILVGPVLEASEKAEVDYGTHMRPGEGTAMAAYVQSGKRIPRRGEVGMSADQISSYEDLGYVMSGSRHNRMNAIRIRKENQVYTAEEKAALAMFNMEENKRKEQKILGDMQRLVQKTIGEIEDAPEGDDAEPTEQ